MANILQIREVCDGVDVDVDDGGRVRTWHFVAMPDDVGAACEACAQREAEDSSGAEDV